MSTPIIPSSPSRPTQAKGRTLTHLVRGVGFGREKHPSGGHYCERIYTLALHDRAAGAHGLAGVASAGSAAAVNPLAATAAPSTNIDR
ncbi:MAG: hypothetical protein KGL97_19450, partial [Alphaproteobacteria bacterium]|nr:hypothetical protein [Alphaproteobacteria bacterium]